MISPLHQYVFAGGPSTIEACYDNRYRQAQDDPSDRKNYDSCERFRDDNNGKNPYFVFGPIGSVQAEQGYSFDVNCVSTECIKLKVRLMCDVENELIPSYLDCRTILGCIDLEEQIKMYCAGGYSLTIVKT